MSTLSVYTMHATSAPVQDACPNVDWIRSILEVNRNGLQQSSHRLRGNHRCSGARCHTRTTTGTARRARGTSVDMVLYTAVASSKAGTEIESPSEGSGENDPNDTEGGNVRGANHAR